jgi:hypothetical protein
MNLTEFISNTVTSAEESKNLLSTIVGFNSSHEKTMNSIIDFYESIPNEFKSNDELFAPIFFKLFSKYKIKSEQLKYYEKFHTFWSSFEQEKIKQENKEILQNTETLPFKNSLEFAKALSAYKNKNLESLEFIKNNELNIKNLIAKNKPKFIENLSKHNCWETIIVADYETFKTFCKNFSINQCEIIKNEYLNGYYGFKYLINKIGDEQMLSIFQDISKEPNFFSDSSFFSPSHLKKNRNQPNIFHVALMLITEDMFKSFSFLYKTYPKEIELCMTSYFVEHSPQPPEINNSYHWFLAVQTMINNTRHTYHKEPLNELEAHRMQNKINCANIIHSIILNDSLIKNEPIKIKKIKI